MRGDGCTGDVVLGETRRGRREGAEVMDSIVVVCWNGTGVDSGGDCGRDWSETHHSFIQCPSLLSVPPASPAEN